MTGQLRLPEAVPQSLVGSVQSWMWLSLVPNDTFTEPLLQTGLGQSHWQEKGKGEHRGTGLEIKAGVGLHTDTGQGLMSGKKLSL